MVTNEKNIFNSIVHKGLSGLVAVVRSGFSGGQEFPEDLAYFLNISDHYQRLLFPQEHLLRNMTSQSVMFFVCFGYFFFWGGTATPTHRGDIIFPNINFLYIRGCRRDTYNRSTMSSISIVIYFTNPAYSFGTLSK